MKVYQPRRGGAWYYRPWFVRASDRDRNEPSLRSVDGGFRCALIVVWRRR